MGERSKRALLMSPGEVLRLPRRAVAEITAHALDSSPLEACGLLAAERGGRVCKVFATRNAEEGDPAVRYLIDAGDQLKSMREAEASGLEIVGAFHSHVASEAYPSPTDVELAAYPEKISRYETIDRSELQVGEKHCFRRVLD